MEPQLTPEQRQAFADALYAGRKIEAIKQLRELSGLGLKDSKEIIDRLEAALRAPSSFCWSLRELHCGCSSAVDAMTPRELKSRLDSAKPPRLLDVRQPDEHAFVALPNSTLIPLGELLARADEIDEWRDEEVIVYCHHGIRSAQAVAQLKALGFTNVHNLSGGIDRWTDEVDSSLPRY
jgi:rhodanese-related sulfurtransferase